MLSVDPSLLYLLGAVWEKLASQFQQANKLELRRRLYATKLQAGGSVQQHIKEMTEISLAVIGDAISGWSTYWQVCLTLSRC